MTSEQSKLAALIVAAVEQALPGAHVEVEATPSKLGAFVIYHGFAGLPMWNRMHAVWRTLEDALTPAERRTIGGVMCLAPADLPAIQRIPAHRHIGKGYVRMVT